MKLYNGMTHAEVWAIKNIKSEIGYSSIGRPIERVTFWEEPDGHQAATVWFHHVDMRTTHMAKSIDGLAHELALEYGINPEFTLRKGATK